MKVYFHPRDAMENARLWQYGFADAWHLASRRGAAIPRCGVLLDSEAEPPFRRSLFIAPEVFTGGISVPTDYDFNGHVEIEADERVIADFEVDGIQGRRQWIVPADLLNEAPKRKAC